MWRSAWLRRRTRLRCGTGSTQSSSTCSSRGPGSRRASRNCGTRRKSGQTRATSWSSSDLNTPTLRHRKYPEFVYVQLSRTGFPQGITKLRDEAQEWADKGDIMVQFRSEHAYVAAQEVPRVRLRAALADRVPAGHHETAGRGARVGRQGRHHGPVPI